MRESWKDYLTDRKAVLTGTRIENFGGRSLSDEARESEWVTELSQLAVLRVSGADATDFLQAQFCNDLNLVSGRDSGSVSGTSNQSQLSGYCSPKGRLLALFQIYQIKSEAGVAYRMIVSSDIVDALQRRLSMFVLRADVKFEKEEGLQLFGVSGAASLDAIKVVSGEDIADIGSTGVINLDHTDVIAMPGQSSRFLLVVDSDVAMSAWKVLSGVLTEVGDNRWELAEIEAGIPQITEATADKLIPQMVNLQAVEGLSFKKGCYPGQEIVARMQYLGKLKRQMCLASVATDQVPEVGASVLANEDADAGLVVRAAINAAGHAAVLMVTKKDIALENLSVQGFDGLALAPGVLPYSLETAS